jgi:hypothetical protein
MRLLSIVGLALLIFVSAAPAQDKAPKSGAKKTKITWKRVVLDTKFRSEGVAVADVDKDGKKDILVGEMWYKAPDWKPHVIRKDVSYDPHQYSKSFALWTDDIDGDGWADQVLVGFPGEPSYWYKNPGKDGGAWKEYKIEDNACNETPQYVDLLGTGKRGLLIGHHGEMCFFFPGSDPTKPWDHISISGPKVGGKDHPGTNRFSHGLGIGDVNGDGKRDVLIASGWWEQPSTGADKGSWKFHPYRIPDCSDIYAFDVDGDGKNDLICSAAHSTGFWWSQQRAGKTDPTFVTQLLFPIPSQVAARPLVPVNLSKEESDALAVLTKTRADQKKVPWRLNAKLVGDARNLAVLAATTGEAKVDTTRAKYPGEIVAQIHGDLAFKSPADLVREFFEKFPKARDPYLEVGVGLFTTAVGAKKLTILLGDNGGFAMPGQTHSLNFVDIDGDGLKDFVTGRRFWAHGPGGDDQPGDPAYLYWFKAKKDKNGATTFTPMKIDDDSGVGTQFACEDVDGDGLMDVIVSNKKGTFLFLQRREEIVDPVAPPRSDK